ncbi:MAG: hypothetical protein RIS84_103 [Pseudomonadota bacterium]|jgi:hypothetical protein
MFKAIIVSLVAGAAYMIGQVFISKHQVEVSQVITKIEGSIQQSLGHSPTPNIPIDKSFNFPHYKECHYFFLSKACKVGLWGVNENNCIELPNYSGEGLIADTQQCYFGQFTAGKFHGKGVVYYAHGGKYEGLFLDGKKVETETAVKKVDTPVAPPKVEPEIPKPPASFANYEACHQFFTQRNCQTSTLWNVSKNQCSARNNYNGEAIFSLNQQCYFGEFTAGKYQGKGTLYYVGGEKYEGNFQAGKKHGQGTLITRESQLAGQWQDDKWLSAPR